MPDNKLPKYIASNKDKIRNPSFVDGELSQLYNPDEAVRNWFIDYINSPKYKERLVKSGYTNPNQVVYDRRNRVQNTKIIPKNNDKTGSAYVSLDNNLFMDNNQVSNIGTLRDDILSHEFSHVTNSSVNARLNSNYETIESPSNTSLNEYEEEYIGSRNKKVGPGLFSSVKYSPRIKNETASHILSDVNHDYSPYENKSDIDAFRYILNKEGIYNAGQEDFTPELLKKAKDNKNVKKAFNPQRLFNNFSDKDIIDIMNNVAYNSDNSNNINTIANNGIKLAEGGDLNKSRSNVKNYYNYYLNSPKYKERLLTQGYSQTEIPNIIKLRSQNLNNARVSNTTHRGEGSIYKSQNNSISYDPSDLITYHTNPESVLAHEYSHATGSLDPIAPVKDQLTLNDYSRLVLKSRNKLGSYVDDWKSGKVDIADKDFSEKIHDSMPYEFKADMDSFRYNLYKDKLYDPGKQDFNQDILNKAKQKYKNNGEVQRFFNNVKSDKDLIYLMNNIAVNNDNNSDMANNGIRLDNGGPIEDPKKTTTKTHPTTADIKKKYANNQYVANGREQWGEYLDNKKLPFSGHPVKQAIYNAAKVTNINPDLLYSSAMEEGLREGIDKPDTVSEAYLTAIGEMKDDKGKTNKSFDPNQYPVDGFRTYGLDTFGDQYNNLVKKGYLPKDFDTRFTKFKALNEQKQQVTSAAFKSEDDALVAKAAMLRNTRDNLNNYTKQTNIPLSDKQRDFFTLVGYNAGEGNMQKMIKSYQQKGYLKDDKFLDNTNFKPASYSQPYTYAQRRLQNMQVLDNEGYFQDYVPDNQATSSTMPNGGKIYSETPEQKLARYQAIYGTNEGINVLKQEASKYMKDNSIPTTQKSKRYSPDPVTTNTKAALATASLVTPGPISSALNAVGVGGDLYTGTRYLMDGQYKNAGLDYLQAGIGLIPTFSNTFGMKGEVITNPLNKWIRAAKTTSDMETIREDFNNGGGLSRSKDYGSKKKPYPNVNKSDFARGNRSYPIPTHADAVDALRLAGLHHRDDVKRKVYAKYPDLKKNNGGYLTFNHDIYNDLYPDGEYTDLSMNSGGSIYDVVPNGFNPQAPQRQNPFDVYAEEADFGYPEGFYTEDVANSGIHIKKENRGKFTATKKKTGKTTEQLTHSKNPLTRKRAIFAQNARKWHHGNDGLALPYIDTMEGADPLEQANNNIHNFFNDPNNSYVSNDATLNGDNIDLQNTVAQDNMNTDNTNTSNSSSRGQQIARGIGNMLSGVNLSTAPLISGTAALVNYATRGQDQRNEYAKRVRLATQVDTYNPFKYGTGSQAIMNDGGNINNSVKPISDNQFSSPIYEFVGPSHEEGGIPINYMGNDVEVEGGETVFMDNGGDLNVFGNMYIPGTNKKFKTVSKNIANDENKTQKNLNKSVDLVNTNDPSNTYQKFRFNAGKVMMGANKERLEELDDIKNELSNMQNLMLRQGYNENTSKKLEKGGKLNKRIMMYDDGGDLVFDPTRGAKTTKSRKPNPLPTVDLITPNIKIDAQVTPPPRRLTTIQPFDSNITDDNDSPLPQDNPGPSTIPGENTSRRRSSVPWGQLAPEILTLATERPEFVPGQTYQPELYSPYQVSFQDRLNDNNAAFRALAVQNSNNPALMSQLAANKYNADNNVRAEEFRTNQGIQNDIINKNVSIINDAKLRNLQLNDTQLVRQSQARSNTRENIRNAVNSISSKIAQANLEQQTLDVYENMFPHFTFDENNKLKFQDVDRPVFTSGTRTGNVLPDNQRSRVKYDPNGKVKESVITTPSKRDQDKLDLQIDKARKQRLSLYKSIFG